MHTIKLFRANGYWQSQHSDPAITDLFGSDTLPTPYSDSKPAAEVLATIQRLNPDCEVSVIDNGAQEPEPDYSGVRPHNYLLLARMDRNRNR